MKFSLISLMFAALLHPGFAAPRPSADRTITDVKLIPLRVLKRAISPKFYDSLLVSPIAGSITVRASLIGTRLFGARVVHSELGGAYDALALQRAQEIRVLRHFKIDTQNPATPILVHLLIYQIADGTLALSFANLDEPGGEQLDYFGCARLAVLKADGSWTEIKGPEGLEGKGMMVRATGVRNSLDAIKLLERIVPGGEK